VHRAAGPARTNLGPRFFSQQSEDNPMIAESSPSDPATAQTYSVEAALKQTIAIVGGGVAGMLCAYVLSSEGHSVDLFESSDLLGGRIRSFRFNDATLSKLEGKADKDRGPVKDEAHLSDALKPGQVGTGRKWLPPEYDGRAWDHLEFNAEFGPMRVELEVQRMLDLLLKMLEIPPLSEPPPPDKLINDAHDLVRMQRFPPFSSPSSAGDPVYVLNPEEEGKDPLELLKLGVCRAVVDLHFQADGPESDDVGNVDEDAELEEKEQISPSERKKITEFEKTRATLLENLNKASATQRPIAPIFESWVRNHLHEDDYWVIQRYGQVPVLYGAERYIRLHTMGFWNLMAAYLSHNALTKVRDLGAFYHLIPENPNAGEWLAWWVRQISISSHLEGVFGGMQSIIEKLTTRMKTGPGKDNLTIHTGSTVTELIEVDKKIGLTVAKTTDGVLKVGSAKNSDDTPKQFDRIILALPTVPAEKLIQSSTLWAGVAGGTKNKTGFAGYLHSALPFQLLKAFFVVRERWWEEDVRANPGVTRYPTREVYFWKSRMKDSRRGLVMLYTDRPAATFWANYVSTGSVQADIDELAYAKPPANADAEEHKTYREVRTLRARMKSRFVEYVNAIEGQKITPNDIIWCGIMDWGREPYGAASHTWRPNREYWNTLAELADWEIPGINAHIHVCGEAYSDYHAFIEGALRSAVHVLTHIPRTKPAAPGAPRGVVKADRLFDILEHQLGAELEKDNIKTLMEWDAAQAATKAVEAKSVGGQATVPDATGSAERDTAQSETPPVTLVGDDKYVKDFIDWSTQLDEIAETLR